MITPRKPIEEPHRRFPCCPTIFITYRHAGEVIAQDRGLSEGWVDDDGFPVTSTTCGGDLYRLCDTWVIDEEIRGLEFELAG